MWKWVIRLTIMKNSFNAFNTVIRSREVEPFFMVLDGVSLFIIRQCKCSPMCSSLCPTAIPHLHTLKWWCLTEYSEKMETLFAQISVTNINSGYDFSIAGLQWLLGQMANDGGNIVGSDNIMQQRTSQLRGNGEDLRDSLQGSGIKVAIWESEKTNSLLSNFKVNVTFTGYFSSWSFLLF